MESSIEITLAAVENLAASRTSNVTFQLPAVLSRRLDEIVQALEREGVDASGEKVVQRTTSRKEVVAALVFAADPDTLEAMIESYREARAGEALLESRKRGTITLPVGRPGMRLTSEQEKARSRGDRPATRNRSSEFSGERRSLGHSD
jgi:hypothetical protein